MRDRKLIIFFCVQQTIFPVPSDVRLYTTHLFIMRIPNRQKLYQTAINYSPDTNLVNIKGFKKKALQNHTHF